MSRSVATSLSPQLCSTPAQMCSVIRESESNKAITPTTSSPRSVSGKRACTKLLQVKASGSNLERSSPLPASLPSGSTTDLTEQDIDDIVLFLLEKLNDYSDELNGLSTSKEMAEKELKSLSRQLLKHASKIKLYYGNRTLAVVEIYFEKMLRLCMREMELQHCFELQSDMEDELQIVGNTIEHFDYELQHEEIWGRAQNLTLHSQHQGQLAHNLGATSVGPLPSEDSIVQMEIVERMREKMHHTCKQLSSLYDKIINMKIRHAQDRANFERFCQMKQSELRVVMPCCQDYFDARLSSMILKPRLEKLSTKIDRIRRAYAGTMKDLYLVSCYIRQANSASKPDSDKEMAPGLNEIQFEHNQH